MGGRQICLLVLRGFSAEFELLVQNWKSHGIKYNFQGLEKSWNLECMSEIMARSWNAEKKAVQEISFDKVKKVVRATSQSIM